MIIYLIALCCIDAIGWCLIFALEANYMLEKYIDNSEVKTF